LARVPADRGGSVPLTLRPADDCRTTARQRVMPSNRRRLELRLRAAG